MTTPTHLLYLHGFRSSPQSTKARMLAEQVQQIQKLGHDITWVSPQLPPSPCETAALIRQAVAAWPIETTTVIGSSLGGFYATWLAEQAGCRAVVINPAVAPARDLARHIGMQTSYHDPESAFYFRPEFIDEFKAMDPYPITRPERYHALITTGDEVLDWQEMRAAYLNADLQLVQGSDHAVSDFEQHLPEVWRWLGLPGMARGRHE